MTSARPGRSGTPVFANLPLGKQTTQGLELNVTHRFNKGFALSAAYSGNRMRYLEFLNEYDRVITSATAASPRFIQFVTRFTF